MQDLIQKTSIVPEDLAGCRLDIVAAQLFPDFSRAKLQIWIKYGQLTVNSQLKKAKDKVSARDILTIRAVVDSVTEAVAEAIPLTIIFEDEHLIVINKPAGLVVHPAAGHKTGTLLNALLNHHLALANLPRSGIIHRLDKDTTGLMVIAKTLSAHTYLVRQLQDRLISREYEAIVNGQLIAGGTIETMMGRHPVQRKKMAVLADDNQQAKKSITHYKVVEKFRAHTHVRIKLVTGRTHQIRVHFSHQHHPLVGDYLYGGKPFFPKMCQESLKNILMAFKRQALHAKALALTHPLSHEKLHWEIDLPDDMQTLLRALREDKIEHQTH